MTTQALFFNSTRKKYNKYKSLTPNEQGLYALGTFLNLNASEMTNGYFQLYPSDNSVTMFNTLRSNIGDTEYMEHYKKDYKIYLSENNSIKKALKSLFPDNHFSISAEGAEFLDGVGNTAPEHTIRLIEAVDNNYQLYYILMGGLAPIELKNIELSNAKLFNVDKDMFFQDDDLEININIPSIDKFALALAKDYFKRELTLEDIELTKEIFHISNPFLSVGEPFSITLEPAFNSRIVQVIKLNKKWTPVV
ncbi:hypothetical protein [Carnobacterium sp. TMP28]|uniref:hypothetical protein n=1 Tax=Carnobacterium sp. TMP28 TaxID=3397060 RepID=UPI0039E0646D